MDVPAISTENLTRRFGELVAVDDMNLRVAAGQFFGFLGPNGAGKSTTIKMLTGLLAPSAGRMEILGLDLVANPVEVKRQIGVVPEGMALFGRLTGADSGKGRLPEPAELLWLAEKVLAYGTGRGVASTALAGRRVLISAGGTRDTKAQNDGLARCFRGLCHWCCRVRRVFHVGVAWRNSRGSPA